MSKLPIRTPPERQVLSPWTKAILELVQGLLPALTAIGAGIWVAYTYFDHEQQVSDDQKAKAIREDTTRLLEAQKPFNNKQLELYIETAQVVGRLASADEQAFGKEEWKKDARRFDALYWSELSMVEDDEVKKAMVAFRPVLQDVINRNSFRESDRTQLQNGAYRLAKALNASIASTWVVALSEITKTTTQLCSGMSPNLKFCPKNSTFIDCSTSIESWAKRQECLKYSVTLKRSVGGGQCGWSIYEVECSKRK